MAADNSGCISTEGRIAGASVAYQAPPQSKNGATASNSSGAGGNTPIQQSSATPTGATPNTKPGETAPNASADNRPVQQMDTITVNGYKIDPDDDPESYRQVYQAYLNHNQDQFNDWWVRTNSRSMERGIFKEFFVKPVAFTLGGIYFGALTADMMYLNTGRAAFIAGGAGDLASIPRGFASARQFASACNELCSTLGDAGVVDASVGVRGSSVTGSSFRTGAPFGPSSDIDFFIQSDQLTNGLSTSRNIPGFVYPNNIYNAFPTIGNWAERWSGILGREVSVGGFRSGTVPPGPTIPAP
jgi:hypothetical protein